jgi:hypothetical protein
MLLISIAALVVLIVSLLLLLIEHIVFGITFIFVGFGVIGLGVAIVFFIWDSMRYDFEDPRLSGDYRITRSDF